MIPGAMLPGLPRCCTHHALSFFESEDKAAGRLRDLHERTKGAFVNRAGGSIARVAIDSQDGGGGKVSKTTTHFDFHERETADFARNAVITQTMFDE
jgi:hypothetical protein